MPIDTEKFYDALVESNLDLFSGVPDSLLKSLCACIADKTPAHRHVIAANEGNAVATACGYHLATGHFGVVYLQNSGIGNAVNPLLSLADEDVYSIPLLMVVGWRGEPGVPDEPQHVKQGKTTLDLLGAMGIACEILDEKDWRSQVSQAADYLLTESKPFALVVRKNTFTPYPFEPADSGFVMTREEALEVIVRELPKSAFIVSTTGKTSREVFEIRERFGQTHDSDFLTVGSMGHASSIALGMALGTDADIWCIDGDGALLMHTGSLPVIAAKAGSNFKYIVNVNGVHESVGGQPTGAPSVDIPGLLRCCGFDTVAQARTATDIVSGMARLRSAASPSALVFYTHQGSRADLGRPTVPPQENKKALMRALKSLG